MTLAMDGTYIQQSLQGYKDDINIDMPFRKYIIVTVQYHDNRETLFLTHIDRRFLYYFLCERFGSRHILTTGSCIIF
jgi:hypothetical protein